MMNFFKKDKRSAVQYDFSNIFQDIHSHILPGIDDGSPNVGTSIALLSLLKEAGFNKFICTPHIISDLYRNTPETIQAALTLLKKACLQQGLEVELSAAGEYMMDDYFMELLRGKQRLLALSKNYVLTELSYATAPSNLEKIAFELVTNGYQPLMAHPERYFYYHQNFDAYFRMKELGFLLQVNLLSLAGYYGKSTEKAARFIFENNLADYVGTDLHHIKHLKALLDNRSKQIFQEVLGDKVYNKFD